MTAPHAIALHDQASELAREAAPRDSPWKTRLLGLSPLIVLIGLAFWSLLWGLVGMVLAVPLTVIFKIILEHTPATRPIASLMSDQE